MADLVHELAGTAGLVRCTAAPRHRPRTASFVMVATHMDAIGLMVTGVMDGFLRVAQVGGVDTAYCRNTGHRLFHRKDQRDRRQSESPAVAPAGRGCPIPRGTSTRKYGRPVPLANLFMDTGLQPRKVAELVRVGDLVSFAQAPVELSGETISGHTLDNRASVAALTICLEELQSRPHFWDVWAVATSQEEVGMIGATGSTFELRPTLRWWWMSPLRKVPGQRLADLPLGKGPTLCLGPNIHPAFIRP